MLFRSIYDMEPKHTAVQCQAQVKLLGPLTGPSTNWEVKVFYCEELPGYLNKRCESSLIQVQSLVPVAA